MEVNSQDNSSRIDRLKIRRTGATSSSTSKIPAADLTMSIQLRNSGISPPSDSLRISSLIVQRCFAAVSDDDMGFNSETELCNP